MLHHFQSTKVSACLEMQSDHSINTAKSTQEGTASATLGVSELSSTCAVCNSTSTLNGTPLSKCGRCKIVEYCGKDCQVKDWPKHKENCKKSAKENRTKSPGKADPLGCERNVNVA
jgi:hypothetical protein